MGSGASAGGDQTTPTFQPSPFILSQPPNVLHLTYCPSTLGMIYPQLVQPSTPASPLHITLFTPRHNLLCHPDLPALSHSKQTTIHRWIQRSQDISCSSWLGMPPFRWRPVAWQWEVIYPPHRHLHRSIQPNGNRLQEEASYCVVNKSTSAAGPPASNKALNIGFVACQNIWVNFALHFTMSKAMFVCETVGVMKHYLSLRL